MPDLKVFEAALMKHLSHGEVDKTLLKNVSSAIVNLKKNGLEIDQVHIRGKVRPDKVLINGIVDPEFMVVRVPLAVMIAALTSARNSIRLRVIS